MNERRIRRIWIKSIRNRDRKINRSTEADRKIAGKNRKNRKIRIKRNRVWGNSRSNSRRGISEKNLMDKMSGLVTFALKQNRKKLKKSNSVCYILHY